MPGRAPVCSPRSITGTPLTSTYSTPSQYCLGFSKVPLSLTLPGSKATLADLSSRTLTLDSGDANERAAANEQVGMAINFIVATPYIFAQEGR